MKISCVPYPRAAEACMDTVRTALTFAAAWERQGEHDLARFVGTIAIFSLELAISIDGGTAWRPI